MKRDWTVAAGHVYMDDGISGADFVNRAGLLGLLAVAKQQPRAFDMLVAMDVTTGPPVAEFDRMGREQYAIANAL